LHAGPCDFSGSELSESSFSLFHPSPKIPIQESVDPLYIAENLRFRYQIYEALVGV
jgi:hypothetical protein